MRFNKVTGLLLIVAVIIIGVLPVFAQDEVDRITFWSTELQPERVERQQAIIDAFEEANPGIEVELVVMTEDLMNQLLTLNVAAGTPPDVLLHPLSKTAVWDSQGLLDAQYATDVINELGVDTFSSGALELLQNADGLYSAIPSDGWGQMIFYRADLFEEAGLEPPTSYENILAAAEALHDPDNGFIGFLGASSPTWDYTWQVFEHVALANGATFIDADGNITFDSPEMIEAMEFYGELMNNYGPLEADYYWQQTRADYLAGLGAMTIWSPFLLDELAGLRDSAFPSCEECADDPQYISDRTSVVSAFSGYSNDDPAAWGSVNSLGIAPGASEGAKAFVEYWMNEAYLDGLAIAPEGKFPMRPGTADEPTLYLDGWSELEVGVDRKAKLSDLYDAETLQTIVDGANGYARMGFDVGAAELASAIGVDFFIQENLVAFLNGDITAEEAVEEIQIIIEDMQAEMMSDEG